MKRGPECIPCVFRQVLSVARRITDDEKAQHRVLEEVMALLPRLDYAHSPAEVSYDCVKFAYERLGASDPYAGEKERQNDLMLRREDEFRRIITDSADPLRTAMKLSAAGNIIDLGIRSSFNLDDAVRSALDNGFAIDDYNELTECLSGTSSVMYILDNAGEIVLDKLVIEQLGGERVTAAVRGAPILNDVLMADAVRVGIDAVCRVVPMSGDGSNVYIDMSSELFRQPFLSADVVISKGQANFELLDEVDQDVFFVLMAKCDKVATHLGVEEGSVVLKHGGRHIMKNSDNNSLVIKKSA